MRKFGIRLRNKLFFVVLLLVHFACTSLAPSQKEKLVDQKKESVLKISRYLTIKTCDKDKKNCVGPVVKELESANIEMKFEPFSKGYELGETAANQYRLIENGVPFQSLIRVTKKYNENVYHIYMMLRSGAGLKREGKIKIFSVKDISDLQETKVIDLPIEFEGGTLQAELVIGPSLYVSN